MVRQSRPTMTRPRIGAFLLVVRAALQAMDGAGIRRSSGLLFLFLLLPLLINCAAVVPGAQPPQQGVASAHPLATRAGVEVLDAGGNAFDAAIAVSAALAVVEPYSSGIGGGGFWLLHRASDGKQTMIDGRERAPLAARPDLYLDELGEVIPRASMDGALAAGIPGEPAALAHLAQHYGRLPLSRSLAPAIRLAASGFEIDEHYRKMAHFRLRALQHSESAAGIFLQQGEVPPPGALIRQPELAGTLRALAHGGRQGFYEGEVAADMVATLNAAGGVHTEEDFAATACDWTAKSSRPKNLAKNNGRCG